MSHQIDFKSHGLAKEWYGHWKYSDFIWKIIKGNKPYLINRQPHSTHLELTKQNGFKVLFDLPVKETTSISRNKLAPRFSNFTDDDLGISGAFILSVKED